MSSGQSFLIVDISITAEELIKLYRGSANQVRATARDGRVVRFPARILQPYVTRSGVQGSFRIIFDGHHKFQKIERL
ncbi:DUF2835 domain-containing protein [Gynuella sp.]|uniref:DUF2835 domain-containing protein n=1 Tax=Gynuella sp. TaxID=2969146 RepID=UPI003D0E79BC